MSNPISRFAQGFRCGLDGGGSFWTSVKYGFGYISDSSKYVPDPLWRTGDSWDRNLLASINATLRAEKVRSTQSRGSRSSVSHLARGITEEEFAEAEVLIKRSGVKASRLQVAALLNVRNCGSPSAQRVVERLEAGRS